MVVHPLTPALGGAEAGTRKKRTRKANMVKIFSLLKKNLLQTNYQRLFINLLGVVAHSCDSSTQQAEGGSQVPTPCWATQQACLKRHLKELCEFV